MTELIKRKKNLSNQNSDNNIVKNNDVSGKKFSQLKGASSGLKTKNKFLQDFEKLKELHRNRKGNRKSNICLLIFSCSNVVIFYRFNNAPITILLFFV